MPHLTTLSALLGAGESACHLPGEAGQPAPRDSRPDRQEAQRKVSQLLLLVILYGQQ